MEYSLVQLYDFVFVHKLSKSEIKNTLAEFSCPLDKDIEDFVRNKAYPYEKYNIARTFLVYANDDTPKLCGIFSLSINTININKELSKDDKNTLFGTNFSLGNSIGTHLIGQLSKNYTNNYDKLIDGKLLLKFALKQIRNNNMTCPAPLIRIDCKDNSNLKSFYEENGFIQFTNLKDSENSNNDLLLYLMSTNGYIS